jgi:hypothetical protein
MRGGAISTETGANEAILRRCHAFLIELFHNVSDFFVGILTDRRILARIREESEQGRSPRDRREFSIFYFDFCWPFEAHAAIITPLLTHRWGLRQTLTENLKRRRRQK